LHREAIPFIYNGIVMCATLWALVYVPSSQASAPDECWDAFLYFQAGKGNTAVENEAGEVEAGTA